MLFQTLRCLTTDLTGTRYRNALATVLARRRRPVAPSRLTVAAEGRKVVAAAAGSRRPTAASETVPEDTPRATSTVREAFRAAVVEINGRRVSDSAVDLLTVEPVRRTNLRQHTP